jgi:hypothetical protein
MSRVRALSKRVDFALFWIVLSASLFICLITISKFGVGYPLFDFMTSPRGRFDDYINPLNHAPRFFDYPDQVGGLTPFQVPIYIMLDKLPFYFGLILQIILPIFSIYLLLRNENFSLIQIFSFGLYPFAFCLSRGNNDLWVLPLVTFYFLSIKKFNQKSAGITLAFMVAIDPLLLLLSAFYLRMKCFTFWKYFAALSVSLFSLPCLAIGRNPLTVFNQLMQQFSTYSKGMISGDSGLLFGNSLSGLLKGFWYIANQELMSPQVLRAILVTSQVVSFALFLIIIYSACSFQHSRALALDSFYFCLISFLILFASAGPDYKFIFFLVPYLVNWKEYSSTKVNFFLFLALFLPKHFVWFTFQFNPVGFTINSIMNPVILLTIFAYNARLVIDSRHQPTMWALSGSNRRPTD